MHMYATHAYLPTYFAVTLSMYTLIPTVYRALLKSAVSGTDHRIHTTKESTRIEKQQVLFALLSEVLEFMGIAFGIATRPYCHMQISKAQTAIIDRAKRQGKSRSMSL